MGSIPRIMQMTEHGAQFIIETPALRDWFAMNAPEATTEQLATERGIDRGRNPHNDPHRPRLRSETEIRAQLAYRYADAMLRARQPHPQEGGEDE